MAMRRSFTERISDWPSGTRKRKWGFLHDKVWFPIPAREYLMRPARDHPDYAVFDYWYYRLYLDRRMIWTPFGSIRFHTFHTGDEGSVFHDHPWWFITLPLRGYTETVQTDDGLENSRLVRAWRFHFRKAMHRHFVHEPKKPFSTLILTGRVMRDWKFWPEPGVSVSHREWTNYEGD